jgi:hypothetical protein
MPYTVNWQLSSENPREALSLLPYLGHGGIFKLLHIAAVNTHQVVVLIHKGGVEFVVFADPRLALALAAAPAAPLRAAPGRW